VEYQRIKMFIKQMNDVIYCNLDTWRPRTIQDTHYVRFVTSGG